LTAASSVAKRDMMRFTVLKMMMCQWRARVEVSAAGGVRRNRAGSSWMDIASMGTHVGFDMAPPWTSLINADRERAGRP